MDVAMILIHRAITIEKYGGDFVCHVETPATKVAVEYRMIALTVRMAD
jgi:hypothetical protein